MTPRRLLPLALALLLAAPVAAQNRGRPMPPGLQDLPIGFGPGERPLTGGTMRSVTDPPLAPVRAAAEWDESIGVFCLWDNASLMDELQRDGDVYVITQNQGWWQSWLSSHGIPTTRFHWLSAPTNTWWVRDYGPWFLWDGNGDFGLFDNVYNRPRPLDDVIPGAIANAYGIPYYGTDLVHTGGNYYADGYGNAWSSRLPYHENPNLTEAEVDQRMADYLGITRYVTRELDYDIQHFDTFGKLLAPDTLLWGSFPEGTTPWAWSEGALDHYRTLASPFGWPYEVHRMPLWNASWSWTAYINSLMTNGKIIVPRYNTSHDAEARAIYEAAAPGYTVALVANGGTYWGDSVHCRTRNFIRGDALRIYPFPHWKQADDGEPGYPVRAEVIPPPGASLAANPLVLWSVSGGPPWHRVAMAPTGNPNEWAATLPAQPAGSTIAYWFHARDTAGRTRSMPPVAPAGTYTISVADDTTPPLLEHDALHGLTPADWPPVIECVATDDTGVPDLVLEVQINGVPQPPLPMTREEGTFRFTAVPAGSVAVGDLVRYRITATDHASPPNTSRAPVEGWQTFPIVAHRQVLVVELDQTPDSGSFLVDVCDDLGIDVAYTDSWPATLTGRDVVLLALGMQPADTALTSSQANALTSFLAGGGSALLEGGDAWAQSSTAGVYRSWFGVASASSGSDLPATITGVAGSLAEGMTFGREGERASSDHLTPASGAQPILTAGGQTKALTYSTGTYRTAALSLQTAGLVDGPPPSRAKYLVARLLDHLGLDVELVTHRTASDPSSIAVDLHTEPGTHYILLRSSAPGWLVRGGMGILEIDRGSLVILGSGDVPADGHAHLDVSVPADPSLDGKEWYFQAVLRDPQTGALRFSNRDRCRLGAL